MSEPAGLVSVDLDEMEKAQSSEQPKPVNLSEVKLDGDEIPEDLRGKSASDVVARVKALTAALQVSEQARLTAENVVKVATAQAPRAPEPEPEPAEMNDEQLRQLHEENPLEAIRVMNAQAIRRAERNLEVRLSPLMAGSASSAEQFARGKYAEEFALFGDQISDVVAKMPNSKTVMSNPAAWDDVISFVRGRPGNIERLIEQKIAKTTAPRQQVAQQQQVESVGFSGTEARARPIPKNAAQLDATQKEIAEKLNMTLEEYVKWANV